MPEVPNGIPITELSFEELQAARSSAQRAALNLYGWIAILMGIAGLILPFIFSSWWWLLLIAGAALVWKGNRRSMEQFFLENLKENPDFYKAVRGADVGQFVKIVHQTVVATGQHQP